MQRLKAVSLSSLPWTTGLRRSRRVPGKELGGIDLIVTDHHHIGADVPIAHSIVHPAFPRSLFSFHSLCGATVAFKVSQVLLERLPEEFLDMVALATVADQVPLLGENRVLVKEGLRRITERK